MKPYHYFTGHFVNLDLTGTKLETNQYCYSITGFETFFSFKYPLYFAEPEFTYTRSQGHNKKKDIHNWAFCCIIT